MVKAELKTGFSFILTTLLFWLCIRYAAFVNISVHVLDYVFKYILRNRVVELKGWSLFQTFNIIIT